MGAPWSYPEGSSDCCDAPVWNGVCGKCHEHCGCIDENDPEYQEDNRLDYFTDESVRVY